MNYGKKIILLLLTAIAIMIEMQNSVSVWYYIITLVVMIAVWNVLEQE